MDTMTQFIEQSARSPFCMREFIPGRISSTAAMLQRRNDAILEVLAVGPCRVAVIGLAIGISTETVSDALKRMQKRDLVGNTPEGKGKASLWWLV